MLRPYFMGKIFNCSMECQTCKSYHRKDNICKRYTCKCCGMKFKKDDKVIRETYSYKERTSGQEYSSFAVYHLDCYRKQLDYWIEGRFNKLLNRFPKKIKGRPKIHQDGKVINQLKALQRYHRLAGHQEQVDILESKIRGLEI